MARRRRLVVDDVVDDDEANLEQLSLRVETMGFNADLAASGGSGLERLAKRCHLDLIILDVAMPNMDGVETLTRNLRTHKTRILIRPVGFRWRTDL